MFIEKAVLTSPNVVNRESPQGLIYWVYRLKVLLCWDATLADEIPPDSNVSRT